MSTNKIDLVRAEIERLYNQSLAEENRQAELGLKSAACTSYGKSKVCKELLSFIDSMREEATSVWHDANTLPSDPKAVIVEHNEYSTSICRAEQMSRVKGAKWAYIDDLLKL